jgi:hypothetical protein
VAEALAGSRFDPPISPADLGIMRSGEFPTPAEVVSADRNLTVQR